MSLCNLLRWLASYKRPLFACVAVCVTLGSVALYAYFIRTLPPLPRAENLLEVAKGKFDIEITLTFDAEADKAFLLEPTSVEVSLEGEPILQETQNFRAGHPVVAENVPGVKVGDNDFHVAVYSGDAARNLTNAADSESDSHPTKKTTPWLVLCECAFFGMGSLSRSKLCGRTLANRSKAKCW